MIINIFPHQRNDNYALDLMSSHFLIYFSSLRISDINSKDICFNNMKILICKTNKKILKLSSRIQLKFLNR